MVFRDRDILQKIAPGSDRRFDQLGGQGTVLCLLIFFWKGDREPSPVSPARAVSQEKNRSLCTESAEGPVFDS